MPLEKQIAFRITARDEQRIAVLAQRIQIATEAAVMRAALRVGLDALERDPALIFEPQAAGEPERCEYVVADGKPCHEVATATDRRSTLRVCEKHFEQGPPHGTGIRRLKPNRKS
jgi:hypothetical protein